MIINSYLMNSQDVARKLFSPRGKQRLVVVVLSVLDESINSALVAAPGRIRLIKGATRDPLRSSLKQACRRSMNIEMVAQTLSAFSV